MDFFLRLKKGKHIFDDSMITWRFFSVFLQRRQRVVDDCNNHVNEDDEREEAEDEHDDSAEHARLLPRLFVLHAHVTYRQARQRRPQVAEIVHHCAETNVRQWRKRD